MALSFYLEMLIFYVVMASTENKDIQYWIGLGHPVSRLPVFFMGICAGLLCVRIQNGDIHALNSKGYKGYLKKCILFLMYFRIWKSQ